MHRDDTTTQQALTITTLHMTAAAQDELHSMQQHSKQLEAAQQSATEKADQAELQLQEALQRIANLEAVAAAPAPAPPPPEEAAPCRQCEQLQEELRAAHAAQSRARDATAAREDELMARLAELEAKAHEPPMPSPRATGAATATAAVATPRSASPRVTKANTNDGDGAAPEEGLVTKIASTPQVRTGAGGLGRLQFRSPFGSAAQQSSTPGASGSGAGDAAHNSGIATPAGGGAVVATGTVGAGGGAGGGAGASADVHVMVGEGAAGDADDSTSKGHGKSRGLWQAACGPGATVAAAPSNVLRALSRDRRTSTMVVVYIALLQLVASWFLMRRNPC